MNISKRILIFSWMAVFIWATVIFCFSAQNATESSTTSKKFTQTVINIVKDDLPDHKIKSLSVELDFFVRKLAHFSAYLLLGTLLYNAFRQTRKTYIFLPSLLCSVVYAISDEVHQHFVPGRACRMFDVMIDSAGSLTGICIFILVLYIYKKRTRKLRGI